MTTTTRTAAEPLLSARHLEQQFNVRGYGNIKGGVLRAVRDVSFDIWSGETLGLVGESGSGKTFLARALLQEAGPRSGSVIFLGKELVGLRGRVLLQHRRRVQMVFQDPFASLNPTWRVSAIVEEPLLGYRAGDRAQRCRRVGEVLEQVGLPESTYGRRRPHELSGGQCQRVAIARALMLEPALLICDEALSALDVLIQAQLLNLFEDLRTQLRLSYLFISHDLALVKQISDRVAVLYLGQLCEIGPTASLYREPLHPYTLMLLEAVAGSGRIASALDRSLGELPSPLRPPSGCRFRTRCPEAQERCVLEEPKLRRASADHLVACHFPGRASLRAREGNSQGPAEPYSTSAGEVTLVDENVLNERMNVPQSALQG
jgi:oligopeptide/dipeptide ABC transporter ATP-binding protein